LFLDPLQKPRGVLNPVVDDLAVLRCLFSALDGPAGDGDDLIEIAFQRCFYWLRLLPRSCEQVRLGQNPLAGKAAGATPGVIEIGGLARGPRLLREDLRHALALLRIDARRRRQIAHGNLRGDVAVANLLLDRFRKRVHQRQSARHPSRTAVETPREFVDCVAGLLFHLRQQPALFERRLRFAVHAQGTDQQQGFGFAHRVQNDGLDGVPPNLFERGDALVAVDHQILRGLLDDDDGRLLSGLSQRGHQPPEPGRVADPEMGQAAVQLMKLQSLRHGGASLGFQYARRPDWSFAATGGCWLELLSGQWDSRVTGLSRRGAGICP